MKLFDAGTKKMSVSSFSSFIKYKGTMYKDMNLDTAQTPRPGTKSPTQLALSHKNLPQTASNHSWSV